MIYNLEILPSEYGSYVGEPGHIMRFITEKEVYMCGFDVVNRVPIIEHALSIKKIAKNKNYKLTSWTEVPKNIQKEIDKLYVW